MQKNSRKTKSRGNGQGTAYKRGSGSTWTAQVIVGWRVPDDEKKRPIPIKRTKAGFATKKEAIAYCPVLLAGGVEKHTESPRLSEYWEIYRKGEYTKLSKSKQNAYKIAWNKLKAIHEVRLDAITVDVLRRTVSESCKTFYPARDCKTILTSMYRLAGADGAANASLPSYIILPPLEEKERVPFSAEEQAALWRLYESGDLRAAIPLMMIYTGMMPGEAYGLRVENIDLDRRIIVNSGLKTKVRKRTPIVIAESLVPLMRNLVANAQPDGFLFYQKVDSWYNDYYDAISAAGCRKLTPYSCRHTTATALTIAAGVDPQTVSRVMRWSSSRMLDRYAHPSTNDALSAVDLLKTHKPEESAESTESAES